MADTFATRTVAALGKPAAKAFIPKDVQGLLLDLAQFADQLKAGAEAQAAHLAALELKVQTLRSELDKEKP